MKIAGFHLVMNETCPIPRETTQMQILTPEIEIQDVQVLRFSIFRLLPRNTHLNKLLMPWCEGHILRNAGPWLRVGYGLELFHFWLCNLGNITFLVFNFLSYTTDFILPHRGFLDQNKPCQSTDMKHSESGKYLEIQEMAIFVVGKHRVADISYSSI